MISWRSRKESTIQRSCILSCTPSWQFNKLTSEPWQIIMYVPEAAAVCFVVIFMRFSQQQKALGWPCCCWENLRNITNTAHMRVVQHCRSDKFLCNALGSIYRPRTCQTGIAAVHTHGLFRKKSGCFACGVALNYVCSASAASLQPTEMWYHKQLTPTAVKLQATVCNDMSKVSECYLPDSVTQQSCGHIISPLLTLVLTRLLSTHTFPAFHCPVPANCQTLPHTPQCICDIRC